MTPIRRRLSFHVLGVLLAASGALISGCSKDEDDAGDDTPRTPPWTFDNTADRPTFEARLGELALLGERARKAGLPKTQTRKPATGSTASKLDLARALMSETPDCAEVDDVFALTGPLPGSRGAGLALTEGQSCGDAVRAIKSYYAQTLDELTVSVQRLRAIRPGGVHCGYRIDDVPVDPALAAVGYRLTPLDAPAGLSFEQQVLGAANDDRIGLHVTVKDACDKTRGDCGGGMAYALVGTSETLANVREKTLDLTHGFAVVMQVPDPKTGGTREVLSEVRTTLNVTGLAEGAKLKAQETSSYVVAGAETAPGAEPFRLGLTMLVEEIAADRLKLSGSVSTNDTGATPQSFAVELQRQGETCRIGNVPPGDAPAGPTPAPDPITRFELKDLEGTWTSECAHHSLGRLGYRHYEESLRYEGNAVVHTLVPFTDTECFTGKEAAVVQLSGTFGLGLELPDASSVDDVREYGLDYAYDKVEITLKDDGLVSTFNAGAVCGKTDWAKDTLRAFAAGECYFELGNSTLLNAYSLRRAHEFTAVRPAGSARVIEVAGTSHERGDSSDLRARLASGNKRRLTRQP